MSRRLFVVPFSWQTVSPLHDDRVAYEMGLDEADKQARIIAFGAIRRVAECARKWDVIAAGQDLDEAHGGTGWIETTRIGNEIRTAIRIAITGPDDE